MLSHDKTSQLRKQNTANRGNINKKLYLCTQNIKYMKLWNTNIESQIKC